MNIEAFNKMNRVMAYLRRIGYEFHVQSITKDVATAGWRIETTKQRDIWSPDCDIDSYVYAVFQVGNSTPGAMANLYLERSVAEHRLGTQTMCVRVSEATLEWTGENGGSGEACIASLLATHAAFSAWDLRDDEMFSSKFTAQAFGALAAMAWDMSEMMLDAAETGFNGAISGSMPPAFMATFVRTIQAIVRHDWALRAIKNSPIFPEEPSTIQKQPDPMEYLEVDLKEIAHGTEIKLKTDSREVWKVVAHEPYVGYCVESCIDGRMQVLEGGRVFIQKRK